MSKTIKIVLSGAESTGKSTLTKQLAEHYGMPYIAEIGRMYVEKLDRPYRFKDVVSIAREQIAAEEKIVAQNPKMVFIDTDLINTKYWFLDVYETTPEWVEDEILNNKADFHLLCDNDLPWEPDPTRENPTRRDYFFKVYKREIEHLEIPYEIISGTDEERLRNAIKCVDEFLQLRMQN